MADEVVLLESGDEVLLESGDEILLEQQDSAGCFLVQEDGFKFLLEDGSGSLLLEQCPPAPAPPGPSGGFIIQKRRPRPVEVPAVFADYDDEDAAATVLAIVTALRRKRGPIGG